MKRIPNLTSELENYFLQKKNALISRVWDNFDETIIKADCEESQHLLLSKLLKIASKNMEFIDFFLVLVFWFKLGILVYDKSLGCATSISRRAPGSGFISLQRHVKDPLTAGYWKICPFAKMLWKLILLP